MREGLTAMNWRTTLVRWVILPLLIVAATFIAWWSYRTTSRLAQSAEQDLLGATLRITREKVHSVEQLIISNDNNVSADSVNPDDLDLLATRWLESADRSSPTVRSVMVLDENQRLVRHVSRAGETDGARFRRVFFDRVISQLQLDAEPIGSHRHLHDTVDGRPLMVTYLTREAGGRRFFVILEADLDYIRSVVFRNLEDRDAHFNVADEDGRLVYGRPLRSPSELVVSLLFPTTLYKWRLSMAAPFDPERAGLERQRRRLDAALAGISLAVLVAGLIFLTYAARNEQRLNQLKSDFIATVSHELKTPLSLIRMFGEMLATERVANDAKRKQYLEIIVRESERLTGLIENVLDFAKLERGKAAYEFHRANLGEVVARAVEMFRYRLDRERPRLVSEIASEIPDSDLDERAIQLLVFNLLDNALKYAGTSDEIVVRVRGDARSLTLAVEDHGPGIAMDDRRRIFERFYRGKSAGAGGARGSGIGLALVKHIADAHGGEVSVKDAVPRGSVFIVKLPIRRGADESGEQPTAPAIERESNAE